MKIKYFKTKLWGDCYVAENNYMDIISISKKYVCLMADDERIFEGAYQEINLSKKNFQKMKEFAIKNKRRNLVGLLNKVYQKNETSLNISKTPFIKIKINNLERYSYLRNYFFKTKPILK